MTDSFLSKPLRLGVIGGSLRSAVGCTHMISSQLDRRWQVVSGCFSSDISMAIKTGEKWGLSSDSIHSDWNEYLSRYAGKIDAVAILTPTPMHAEICCFALQKGIAVICEKSISSTIEQSNQIGCAISDKGAFFAVTYNYSGYPMVRVLREIVRNGQLGEIKHVDIEMPSDAYVKESSSTPQKWRLVDGEIPTLLLDLGVHVCHLMRFITGFRPTAVSATMQNFSRFNGLIDDARMWVQFSGVRGNFWVSKSSLGYRNGLKIRIFGSEGAAFWLQEEPERLELIRRDSTRTTYDRGNTQFTGEIRERFKPGHPSGFIEAFANLYSDIADSLIAHRCGQPYSKYVEGWREAHEDIRLLSAATRAHHQKTWIDV